MPKEATLHATPVVELRGVGKEYQPYPAWLSTMVRSPLRAPVRALASIDLALRPGELCAVVGPNGAGKTTMFRIIAGLTTPDVGSVRVGGIDPIADGRSVRRSIGWMSSDDRSLFLRQTCSENLWFHGRLQNIDRADLHRRIPEMLAQVGLAGLERRVALSLSAGMRARLQLARALLARPRLLVLDEPTGTVDPVAASALIELVRDLVRHHDLAALVSSHRLEEIEALGERVVLLDDGTVLYDGSLERLRDRFGKRQLEVRVRPGAAADVERRLATVPGCTVARAGDDTVVATAPADVTTGSLLVALGPAAADVRQLHERTLPLAVLLARMYATEAERSTP